MADEYIIPFGVDPSRFFEALNKMDEGADNLGTTVQKVGKDMQTAFEGPATAADQLGKKLDEDAKKAEKLRDAAVETGKKLGDALNGKNVGAGLEERLNKVNKLVETTGKKGVKIPFDFDQAKLQAFEDGLMDAQEELNFLMEVVDHAKAKLSELGPGPEFDELTQTINTAEEFLNNLGETVEEVTTKNMSLKSQLRLLKEEMAQMELQGQENTKEFEDMAVAAGILEDQIGDISARVRVLASDTKYIDAGIQAVTGLAGAFAAAQGAIALFGSENEALNEVLKKTTGAMAILQGIQALSTVLNKDSALSILFLTRAKTGNTVATAANTAATTAQAGATVTATTATRSFTAALLANPLAIVLIALGAIVTALIAFTGGSDDAKEATDRLNASIKNLDDTLAIDLQAIEQGTAVRLAMAKRLGKSEAELTDITKASLQERLAAQRDYTRQLDKMVEDAIKSGASLETVNNLTEKARQSFNAELKLMNDITVAGIERETQANQRAKELQKERTENAKKAAEERRAIADQEIKFRREYTAAYIDSLGDEYEKEKAQATARTTQKIEDLKREVSLSAAAEVQKNQLIKKLRENLAFELGQIDQRQEAERAAIIFQGQQKIAELMQEGTDKELEINRLTYLQRVAEITEQFKNEIELRNRLLSDLAEERARKEKEIRDRGAREQLAEAEERAVLEMETAAMFVGGLADVEKEKQLAVLGVKLKFAEDSLNLLISQGEAENSLLVLRAKKQVQDLKKAYSDAFADLQDTGGFDMFKFLGLDSLTDEEKQAVTQAANEALGSIREITGFIVDQYQRQIDAKQRVIDQENQEIKRLESLLEDEKKLREEGFANNVENIEAELQAKKDQRDEDIKQQEEMQKKQQAIQRAQLALDTATQASSLITSAANIFKALSGIPFIGVPLAIATIALMTGAFTTAKVKAFQAIGDRQTFGEGGWIDGKKHSQGGKKYYAADGSVRELEEGEHVTKASQAEKYADLLDAINNDDISRMKEDAFRDMLKSLGIHLTEGAPREAVNIVRERDTLRTEVILNPGDDTGDDIRQINKGVTFLAERERDKVERWSDDEATYERRGSKTIRTPKNKK